MKHRWHPLELCLLHTFPPIRTYTLALEIESGSESESDKNFAVEIVRPKNVRHMNYD